MKNGSCRQNAPRAYFCVTSRWLVIAFVMRVMSMYHLAFFLISCNNYDLREKLENPGAAGPRELLAFVSSVTMDGIASSMVSGSCGGAGTLKADCICTTLAQSAGLPKPRSGKYVAWLSDASAHAKCRIQGDNSNGCAVSRVGPWYNVKKQKLANDLVTMLSGPLLAPIRYDESGMDKGALAVYTGTTADGSMFNLGGATSCSDWTSNATLTVLGVADSLTQWSSDNTPISCGTSRPFYCFEVP